MKQEGLAPLSHSSTRPPPRSSPSAGSAPTSLVLQARSAASENSPSSMPSPTYQCLAYMRSNLWSMRE